MGAASGGSEHIFFKDRGALVTSTFLRVKRRDMSIGDVRSALVQTKHLPLWRRLMAVVIVLTGGSLLSVIFLALAAAGSDSAGFTMTLLVLFWLFAVGAVIYAFVVKVYSLVVVLEHVGVELEYGRDESRLRAIAAAINEAVNASSSSSRAERRGGDAQHEPPDAK